MMNLGNVVKDSTIRIPFSSFDAAGASSATTDYLPADVKIYKDDETTPRSSASGITATAGINSRTGLNTLSIDLSDTAVTDYYEVGSTYTVAVDDVTIDSETVRFWIGQFEIQNAASVGTSAAQGLVRHFFSSGSITVPSWATTVFCGAVGAGGNGSMRVGVTGGAGGGGGGYAEGIFDAVPDETLTITVGTAGGGNSSIEDTLTTWVTGNGGSNATSSTTGAAGGTGSGGDFQATGGDGGNGVSGGGGAAGTAHGVGGNGASSGGGGAPMGGTTTNGDGAGFGSATRHSVIESATGLIIANQNLPLTRALAGGLGGESGIGVPGDFMCGGGNLAGVVVGVGGTGGAFAGGGAGGALTGGNGGMGGGGGGGLVAFGNGGSGYCFVQFIP